MFERVIPTSRGLSGTEIDGELLIGNIASAPARAGGALRALDWSEVTARLSAARDLRELIRSDSRFSIQSGAASFGDAAASYFQAIEDREPDVNHDALAQGKASDGIAVQPFGDAVTGDARDI